MTLDTITRAAGVLISLALLIEGALLSFGFLSAPPPEETAGVAFVALGWCCWHSARRPESA